MTAHFSPPTQDDVASSTLLIGAARCWREARDRGELAQPRLSDMLEAHDCGVLAPVLDSLCLFYEDSLGRPMAVGEALTLSGDELRLLGLVDGTVPRGCGDCPEGAATPLDCALCSTRIMLALALGQRASVTLQ
jgi:hypothetical protein